MQTHLAKIRSDAAECLRLATEKRSKMFAKMAEHLNELASELEKTQAAPSNVIQAELVPLSPRAAHEETGVPEILVSVPQENSAEALGAPRSVERPARLWSWLLAAAIATVAGSSLWAVLHSNRLTQHLAGYLPFFQASPSNESGSVSQGGTNAIAALMATEQTEREAIFKRLSALDAQVEGLTAELEKLRNPQRLLVSPAARTAPTEKNPPRQSVTAPEEKRPLGTGDITNTVDKSSRTSGSMSGNPPTPCERFRSSNGAAGTYVTLDGQRHPCP